MLIKGHLVTFKVFVKSQPGETPASIEQEARDTVANYPGNSKATIEASKVPTDDFANFGHSFINGDIARADADKPDTFDRS